MVLETFVGSKAVLSSLRCSPRKVNLVLKEIRGLGAEKALRVLDFSSRKVAVDLHKLLRSAIANAENNHQVNVDELCVSEAFVGLHFAMKRFFPRAKGRAGRIKKSFSRVTVVLKKAQKG